jgi:hypothetical protein
LPAPLPEPANPASVRAYEVVEKSERVREGRRRGAVRGGEVRLASLDGARSRQSLADRAVDIMTQGTLLTG